MKEGDTFFPCLSAGIEVAFKHETHDGLPAFTELPQNLVGDQALTRVIFLGVVVRTIDHDRTSDAFSGDRGFSPRDMFLLVVRPSPTTTEDDMAVGIAHGSDDRSLAVGIDTDEMVRGASGGHRVDCDLQTSFGPIFKSDRHGQAAGHFSMSLAFRGASPDRRPTDQVGGVLRADRIQQLRSARKAQLIDLEENGPR